MSASPPAAAATSAEQRLSELGIRSPAGFVRVNDLVLGPVILEHFAQIGDETDDNEVQDEDVPA